MPDELTEHDKAVAAEQKVADEHEKNPTRMFATKKYAEEIVQMAYDAQVKSGGGVGGLPEGIYATEDEAMAYVNKQRGLGRFPRPIGSETGSFVVSVKSPWEDSDTVWVCVISVTDDPNFPDEGFDKAPAKTTHTTTTKE
jgi:hypothetical protein